MDNSLYFIAAVSKEEDIAATQQHILIMSNGLLDSSHRRPRRRASLIEELALPVTTLQRNRSSDSYHRPPSNNSRESSQSSSWEHSDTQLNNSSLPACLSDPSDHHHDTTNATDAIRVHRPNWVKSTTTTNNHHMEQAAMSNSARTRRPRPQLLNSASMRSSFTFGRRSTAPDDINALLDGRNNDRRRKNGGGWNHRLSLGNGDRPDMKKVLEDNTTVLSDYQAVFQQMKLQNPTVSLGALQQKTMKRMSELKVEKEEMERMNLQRLRELEEKPHHGNNNGRMTLLGSLFHHRPRAGSDLSDKNSTSGLGSDRLSGRRSTIDTNPLSEADGSTDNNHNGNGVGVGGGRVPSILKTSLIMGEDQTGNFAPRKSVGDFTMMAGYPDSEEEDDDAMLGMDRSRTSGLSKASGLFISGDESENFGGESDNIIGMRMGMESDLYNREEEDNNFDNRDEEVNYEELEILETHLQQLDTSHGSQPHCGDLNGSSHTFHSVISDSNQTTATEGSYTDSGSLIVGFGKQRDEKEDESRGFAADFSAWDNR
mmetsp:Transcript_21021/g.35667  ORF Transcript_21021/g.35667 Transcript_21021/m.35667 type:complete len:541 (-) Transcript_21021:265-1887(-)